MTNNQPRVLPTHLIDEVRRFVESEIHDAATYDNSELMDESTVTGLMNLAAEIYGAGYSDGSLAQAFVFNAQASIQRARTEARRERC